MIDCLFPQLLSFVLFSVVQEGVRELMEELERQGGLSAPMVPRAFYNAPNHKMTRKSQRSNSLRLRFGKRSVEEATGPFVKSLGSLRPHALLLKVGLKKLYI
jgi:hypothetical protein